MHAKAEATTKRTLPGRLIVLAIVVFGAGMGLAGLLLRSHRGPSLPLMPGSLVIVTCEATMHGGDGRDVKDAAVEDPRLTRFELAIAPSSELVANLGSLFTGKMPRESGLVRAGDSLRGELPTLAEMVAGQGFSAVAFVAVGVLDGETLTKSGLSRGFASVVAKAGVTDGELAAQAAEWLVARGTVPSLAWLHLHGDAATAAFRARMHERGVDEHAVVVIAGPLASDVSDPQPGEGVSVNGPRFLARGGFTALSLQLPVALLPWRVDPQVVTLVDVVASVTEAFGIRAPDGIGTPYLLHPDVRGIRLVLATRPLSGPFSDADEVWLYTNDATYVNAPARGARDEIEMSRAGRPWNPDAGDGGGVFDVDAPDAVRARKAIEETFGYRFEEVGIAEVLASEREGKRGLRSARGDAEVKSRVRVARTRSAKQR